MCVCERERGEIGVEEEGKGIQFWLIFKKYTWLKDFLIKEKAILLILKFIVNFHKFLAIFYILNWQHFFNINQLVITKLKIL